MRIQVKFTLLLLWMLISCNSENLITVNSNSNNYPNTELDDLPGIFFRKKPTALVELNLDSNRVVSWKLNGIPIIKSDLILKLVEIQLALPEIRRSMLLIDLGIDKDSNVKDFVVLRDTLRKGNYLRAGFLNSKNKILSVRFPFDPDMRAPKSFLTPPPPPLGVEDFKCFCCKDDGEFRTFVFNYRPKYFENYEDCMRGSKEKIYTYVHLEKDRYYWEGAEISLAIIADSLLNKYTNYPKPNRFFTLIKVDDTSSFESYLNLYAVVRKMYRDRQNAAALKIFDLPFKDLSKENRSKILKNFPMILVEVFENEVC